MSSCSKRMLRVVDTEPEMTKFASGSAEVQYANVHLNTDGTALNVGWRRYC